MKMWKSLNFKCDSLKLYTITFIKHLFFCYC